MRFLLRFVLPAFCSFAASAFAASLTWQCALAGFGALLGRAVGLNGHDTTQVAAIGAINGAENGLAYGSAEWYDVVNRCMARRGYEILP